MTQRGIMRFKFVTFLFLSVFLTYAPSQADVTGSGERKMMLGGRERIYLVRAPRSIERRKSVPLLVVLHGGGKRQDDEKIEDITQFTPMAEREGFVVVYPNAVDHNWNDGRGYKEYTSMRENIDDVGFLRAVIDQVSKDFPIDKSRVYVTGPSNGGMMTYRIACEASDIIAAAAPVIANMPENLIATCRPLRSVPIIATNGTEDPMMPYQGGFVKALTVDAGRVVSTRESVRFWAKNNRCESEARVTELPDIHPEDGATVKKEQYEGCAADTVAYTVEHGGHTWSKIEGRRVGFIKRRIINSIMGNQDTDYDLSKAIWDFLSRQRLR